MHATPEQAILCAGRSGVADPSPQERSKVSEPEPAAPAGPVAEPARTTQVEKGNSDAHALEPAAKPARTPATTSTEKGGDSPRAGTDIADLRAALPGDLQDMALRRSPNLKGHTVRVHYKDGPVWIEAGPHATAVHIQRHVATARFLRKFEGPLGWARRLLFDVRARIKSLPKYGTAGFEARLELEKLTAIEHGILAEKKLLEHKRDKARSLADTIEGDAAQSLRLYKELTDIQEQLEFHASRLTAREAGTGHIAAEAAVVEYPVAVSDLDVPAPALRNRKWTCDISAPLPNGRSTIIATVYLPMDGGAPELNLQNTARVDSVDYKVRVLDRGEVKSLTTHGIELVEKLYIDKFGRPLTELTGKIGLTNRDNFHREYLDARVAGVPHEKALLLAAQQISYGRRRIEAGYTEFEVTVEGAPIRDIAKTALPKEYAAKIAKYTLPDEVYVHARKPGAK